MAFPANVNGWRVDTNLDGRIRFDLELMMQAVRCIINTGQGRRSELVTRHTPHATSASPPIDMISLHDIGEAWPRC